MKIFQEETVHTSLTWKSCVTYSGSKQIFCTENQFVHCSMKEKWIQRRFYHISFLLTNLFDFSTNCRIKANRRWCLSILGCFACEDVSFSTNFLQMPIVDQVLNSISYLMVKIRSCQFRNCCWHSSNTEFWSTSRSFLHCTIRWSRLFRN